MRIPLSWLKEFIPISLAPAEIAKLLTMAGLEVDRWETIGGNLKDIVVGKVLESGKHPNADKLSVAAVTDGKETYQIVCGGPNCRAGIKVALARLGVTIKHGNEEFTIKKAKIRGVESSGMLCAGIELGLTAADDGNILELSDNIQEGTSLADLYKEETFFDISLTPNLSHCTSVFGVARELAALTGLPLHLPPLKLKESDSTIDNCLHVKVADKDLCPRYSCRVISNVEIAPSPDWIKERLENCGVRSVNNVVDATNYVLLELGHPLHAFDYEKFDGEEIVVRKAKDGEVIRTLDGKERILSSSMLAICDQRKPVAIAGVMGGLESEIQEQTRTVVLESAYFDAMSIRRTSKHLGLQSDASKRFERGTDPNQILYVLDRAAQLIQQVAGGEIQAGVIDIQAKAFPEAIIPCRLSKTNQVLGINLSRGEVEDIFTRLQFNFQWDGQDQFMVHVPTYRTDIKAEIDLIEEAARLYGYDNIPRLGGRYLASALPDAPIHVFENEVRSRLIGEGLQEFLTCDLIGPTILQIVQDHSMPAESVVKVLNPTSVEQSILRTSLLPGLLQVVKYNFDHQNHQIRGFEIGRIHYKESKHYAEKSVAALILSGQTHPHHWEDKPRNYDFFDLKGIFENLLHEFGIKDAVFKNIGLQTFHSGRQASIFVGSLEIASFGEIHPSIQRRLDVPQRIIFGEMSLQDLLQLAKPLEKVKPLSIYPGSERDWTFTVRESVPFTEIMGLIRGQSSQILDEASLKDIYRSEKLPKGFQNMTLHFVYRDPGKTVAQEVVEAEHKRLTDAVLKELGEAAIPL